METFWWWWLRESKSISKFYLGIRDWETHTKRKREAGSESLTSPQAAGERTIKFFSLPRPKIQTKQVANEMLPRRGSCSEEITEHRIDRFGRWIDRKREQIGSRRREDSAFCFFPQKTIVFFFCSFSLLFFLLLCVSAIPHKRNLCWRFFLCVQKKNKECSYLLFWIRVSKTKLGFFSGKKNDGLCYCLV
jgi:hypothetical protein